MSFSPPLLFGSTVQFQSRDQLNWFSDEEMRESRLTVISDGTAKLFEAMTVLIRLADEQIGSMTVMAVHHNADLLGLQILELHMPGFIKTTSNSVPEGIVGSEDEPPRESAKNKAVPIHNVPVSGIRVARNTSEHPQIQSASTPVSRTVTPTRESGLKNNQPSDTGSYGGLLLERYGDADYQGFTTTIDEGDSLEQASAGSPSDEQYVEETAGVTQSAHRQIQDGEFRSANLFFPLDKSSLIGFLVDVQSRCLIGELMLKASEVLLTIYTDDQGQLCLSEETLSSLEQMGEGHSHGGQNKQSLQHRVKQMIVECMTTLSRTENVQFRFVPGLKSEGARLALPFTVYCCDVLQNLLKGNRLDSFKSYYEARNTYFVNTNDKALIPVQDFGLGRKPARFFELVDTEEHDLRMLLKVSPVSNGETYRLLRMGELLGLIYFSRDKLTEVDLTEDHLALLKQQFSRSQQGYFDALGAHMVAHPKTYPSMSEQVSQTYGPESEYASHSFRHRELCAQIVRLAQEALEYLSQRRLRVAYRQKQFDKTMLRQAADVLLEKADMNRLRGDQMRMREALEMALELDPILTRQHVQNQKNEAALKPDDVT